MMPRPVLLLGVVGWLGVTLLLSEFRWFRRPHLADRLGPYSAGPARRMRTGILSAESFRDVIAPLARTVGERAAGLLGVREQMELRLRRIHSPLDVTSFRIRQLGWAAVGLGGAALVSVALRLPPALAIPLVVGGPMLVFLLIEQ